MNRSKPRQSGVSQSKNAPAMIHKTARNKVRHILKDLRFAGGGQIEILKERLKFWQAK
jgi:hypothetical protein